MAGTSACGLDTSVVIRLLTGAPKEQADKAFAFIQQESARGRPPLVSDLVVSEAYFALHHHFDVPKREAIAALLEMFVDGIVIPEEHGCAIAALKQMQSGGQKPGFIDRLIHAQYLRSKARLATFEKASDKIADTIVL